MFSQQSPPYREKILKRACDFALSGLIKQMPGFIYWKNVNSEYMGCNQNLAKLSKLSNTQDIVGMMDGDFTWGQEDASSFIEDDQEIMRSGKMKATIHQLPIDSSCGEKMWVRTEKIPLYEDGFAIGVMGIAVDITEQKVAEKNLVKEKYKAELADRSKSEFIANISHDLRTPLGGIMGISQLLTERNYEANELAEFTSYLSQSVNTLNDMIASILDFSKLEAGKIVLKFETLNLETIIQQIFYELSQKMAGNTKVRLLLDYSRNIPRMIVSDRQCLVRILLNLLTNAINFTRLGHVLVSMSMISKDDDTVKLMIVVTDTGCGIPSDKLEFIFQKFNRLDASYSSEISGYGLGLTIVQDLVEYLDGDISVESAVGVGSSFTLCMPLELPANSSENWLQKHTSVFANVKVTIIDDYEVSANNIATHLLADDVNCVSSYEAMISLVHTNIDTNVIHIILMDDLLIEVDYLEVLGKLKANKMTEQCMLVLISGYNSKYSRAKLNDLGFFGCILKPFSSTELNNKLMEYVENWSKNIEVLNG